MLPVSYAVLHSEQYIVTVRKTQGPQSWGSDIKVLFDTFSFKKKYYRFSFTYSSTLLWMLFTAVSRSVSPAK